jgi:hypothetical protein
MEGKINNTERKRDSRREVQEKSLFEERWRSKETNRLKKNSKIIEV